AASSLPAAALHDALPISGEARGDEADPPMQAVLLGRPDELMELRGVIDAAEERVVEAAGDDHAAAPAAKPSQAHRFRVPGTDHEIGRAHVRTPVTRSSRM